MDGNASFAERRARAAELRKADAEALRSGQVPPVYLLSLAFLVALVAVVVCAGLAVFAVAFFTWMLTAVVAAVCGVLFAILLVVIRRQTPS